MNALTIAALTTLAFQWNPAGQLQAGRAGRVDARVYAPGMRFPIENSPAYPNSQVYAPGGSRGGGGGQCDPRNFSYPWWDNFCEPRRWDMPLCPGGTGHQGQDIRAASCANKQHWAVAAEAGRITSIGSYSVYLVTAEGRRHRYLHLDPASLQVRQGQQVARGARIGKVSNAFFDANGNRVGTTVHLHYDLYMPVASVGRSVYVPPYMSLVRSYEELLGQPGQTCGAIAADGGVISEDGPCFQRFGPERFWRFIAGAGVGDSHLWTNAFVNATPSNWARWNLHFAQAGRYRVAAHVTAPYNRAERVPYLIRFAGQERRVVVSQRGRAGGLELGVFRFVAGADQKVEVFDNTGEVGSDLHMTVDALRLTRIRPAPDAGPPPDTGPIAAPDAAAAADPDAGSGASNDAGPAPLVDAGAAAPPADSGCGCDAVPMSGSASLLLLAALSRRRRWCR